MTQHIRRMLLLLSTSLLLILAITACGNDTSTTTTTAPNVTPVPLTTFKGDNYTIGYPQNWQKQQNNNVVLFRENAQSNNNKLAVSVITNTTAPAEQLTKVSAQYIRENTNNAQNKSNVTSTTINGITWFQQSITGSDKSSGQQKVFSIYTTQAPDKNFIQIIYDAEIQQYDTLNASTFQPMLQSFRFV